MNEKTDQVIEEDRHTVSWERSNPPLLRGEDVRVDDNMTRDDTCI